MNINDSTMHVVALGCLAACNSNKTQAQAMLEEVILIYNQAITNLHCKADMSKYHTKRLAEIIDQHESLN